MGICDAINMLSGWGIDIWLYSREYSLKLNTLLLETIMEPSKSALFYSDLIILSCPTGSIRIPKGKINPLARTQVFGIKLRNMNT